MAKARKLRELYRDQSALVGPGWRVKDIAAWAAECAQEWQYEEKRKVNNGVVVLTVIWYPGVTPPKGA